MEKAIYIILYAIGALAFIFCTFFAIIDNMIEFFLYGVLSAVFCFVFGAIIKLLHDISVNTKQTFEVETTE